MAVARLSVREAYLMIHQTGSIRSRTSQSLDARIEAQTLASDLQRLDSWIESFGPPVVGQTVLVQAQYKKAKSESMEEYDPRLGQWRRLPTSRLAVTTTVRGTPVIMMFETGSEKLPPIHPGEILSEEFLIPLGMSHKELAHSIGVDDLLIHDLIRGDSPINAETALLLSRYFDTSAKFWTGLQARYDLDVANDLMESKLNAIKPRLNEQRDV